MLPTPWGLAAIARHVVQRTLNPCFFSLLASDDAASNICRAILTGVLKGTRVAATLAVACEAGAYTHCHFSST
jgi:hypothetical protein